MSILMRNGVTPSRLKTIVSLFLNYKTPLESGVLFMRCAYSDSVYVADAPFDLKIRSTSVRTIAMTDAAAKTAPKPPRIAVK